MWLLSAIISLTLPTYHSSTIPLDSVKIQFTYDKQEPGKNSKTIYYYHLNIQNTSSQTVYVVIPKWFNTELETKGIMREVDDDSHDGMKEFSFYADDSFEIYEVAAKSTLNEDQCRIRIAGEGIKSSNTNLPVYIVHNVKIGELKFDDYVAHKKFYGTNLTYEMEDIGQTNMTVALK